MRYTHAMLLLLAACGAEVEPLPASCPTSYGIFTGFPECTVEVSFSIDDTAARFYGSDGGLAWRGSFVYDAARRILTFDADWGGGVGPYPLLYDDGPFTSGGHEASDAVAGDHVWSVATFIPHSALPLTLDYGAVSGWREGIQGNWIWLGANGFIDIPAETRQPVRVPGLTLPLPNVDLRITVDSNSPHFKAEYPNFVSTAEVVLTEVGGNVGEVMRDDGGRGDVSAGDGIFSVDLSPSFDFGPFRPGSEFDFEVMVDGAIYPVHEGRHGLGALIEVAQTLQEIPVQVREQGRRNAYVTIP